VNLDEEPAAQTGVPSHATWLRGPEPREAASLQAWEKQGDLGALGSPYHLQLVGSELLRAGLPPPSGLTRQKAIEKGQSV
jgi:hypothetical protein